MADVTWVAEVEGNAEESFDGIAGAAAHAGEEAEDLGRKIREIPSLKELEFNARVATAEANIARLRERAEGAEGVYRLEFEAKTALAEAQLIALRESAHSVQTETVAAGGASIGLWQAVGAAAFVAGGAVLGLGAALGGAIAVGALALHGLDGGFGTLTSAAQEFRFELETLDQTTFQHLAAAAQSGFLPGLTTALKDVRPELENLNGSITAFGKNAGDGLGFVLEVVVSLAKNFLEFGNQVNHALGALGDPLRQFSQQLNDVFQRMNDSGQSQQAMSGLVGIIAAILQIAPALIETLIRLSAAFGPGVAVTAKLAADVLGVILNILDKLSPEVATAVEIWLGYVTVMKAAVEVQKAFNAVGLLMDATPIGLVIAAIAALIFIIYELATHWSQTMDGIGSAAKAVGNFIVGLAKSILDFFQSIIDAVTAPFKAVGELLGNIGGAFSGINFPQLADGGVVTRPTLALVGEGPEPEVVSPLSKLAGLVGGGGGSGGAAGGITVHVHNAVIGNEQQIAKTVTNALKTVRGRGGGFYV